jgi:hypothetical protein
MVFAPRGENKTVLWVHFKGLKMSIMSLVTTAVTAFCAPSESTDTVLRFTARVGVS